MKVWMGVILEFKYNTIKAGKEILSLPFVFVV